MKSGGAEERVGILDGMRFVAASAVMLYHFAFRSWTTAGQPTIVNYGLLAEAAKYGYLGVDLFFMISGFVILMSAEGRSAPAFVRSRVIRLYPAYWFSVLCTALILVAMAEPPTAPGVAANLTMFQSFLGVRDIEGVYWTLAFELRFYILMTLVILLRGMPYIDALLGAWLAIGIGADFVSLPRPVVSMFATDWAHYFIAGALAWRMRSQGFTLLRLGLFALAGLQALRHAHWYMALKVRLTDADYHTTVALMLVAAMFLLFLGLATRRLGSAGRRLEILGRLTYPLYLAHATVALVFADRFVAAGVDKWVMLATMTAVSLFVAWFIARWIEPPVAGWLRRWTGIRKARSPAIPGA
jgi:peptidoglycan/LPS O-acetylase OafA/YrhL